MLQYLATTAGQHPESLTLPWGAEAIAGAGLVAGLLLWLWGRKLVKPLYALAFGVGAGLIGFTGPAALGAPINPHILMIALGLFGVIVGLIVFRITMGLTLGMVMGVVVASVAIIAIDASADARRAAETAPVPDRESIDNERSQAILRSMDDIARNMAGNDEADEGDQATSDAERLARSAAEQVRLFMDELFGEVGAWWETIPIRLRIAAVGGWFMGFALGLLLGLSKPSVVAGFASAFVGAAIWLPSGAYLAHDLGLPGVQWLPSKAGAWVSVWIVTACIGAAIQWTKRKPKADQRGTED